MTAPKTKTTGLGTRLRRVGRHAGAAIVMLAGTGFVLALVLTMNASAPPPPKDDVDAAPAIALEAPKPKPKPQRKAPPKPRPTRTARRSVAPPTPALASSLSSVSLGIPEMGAADLGAAADALSGSDAAVRDMVMTEEAVDVPPRPMARNAPDYPARARATGVEGAVTLSLLVGQDGRVLRVKVLDATPPGVFDDAATSTVKGWRFRPAVYRGEPVKVWARQVVRFDLS